MKILQCAKLKGQAAVFDGITLMLLASLSAAMIFAFIGSYGVQEERVIRSAYVLNYMHSVMKAFYYLDASTLKDITDEEIDSKGNRYRLDVYRILGRDGDFPCKKLARYPGSFTIADLLKRDLAENDPVLDDKFQGASIIGITSVHCGLKELLKPFSFSGYFYGFDVIGRNNQALALDDRKKAVTNYLQFTQRSPGAEGMCAAAQQESADVLSIASPFKAVFIDPKQNIRERRDLEIRLCIWRPKT